MKTFEDAYLNYKLQTRSCGHHRYETNQGIVEFYEDEETIKSNLNGEHIYYVQVKESLRRQAIS